MPEYVFGNFFATELTVGITVGATQLQVPPSATLLLPAFATEDDNEARLTLWDGQLPPEIVGCTQNLQDGTLIVTRAKEGTTAQAWSAGTQVVSALTSEVINTALEAYFDFNEVLAASFLKLSGGVLTGPLILDGPPLDPLGAATKLYVDSVQGSGLPLSGGVMQGDINMNSNHIINLPTPGAPSEPATKAYADALVTFPGQAIDDFEGSLQAGGTASAYTVVANVPTPVYVHGQRLCVRFGVTNAANATIAVSGLAARPIQVAPGVNAPAGTLLPGVPTGMTYDGVAVAWIIAETRAMAASELLLHVGAAHTAPLLIDKLGIWDATALIGKSILVPDLFKAVGLLPNKAAPHPTQDLFLLYDASTATAKQATPAQIQSILPPVTLPKHTSLLSGSGATFNVTAGCRQLHIRMAGGGGAGGGVAAPGGNGTSTSFGDWSCDFGDGGGTGGGSGGVGGSAGVDGTGQLILNVNGEAGQTGQGIATNSANAMGSAGGGTPFGGRGICRLRDVDGGSAVPNTGSGGSGAGSGNSTATPGGGAGQYKEFIINTPAASYTYTVGAGGTPSAGIGVDGGAGGSGVILVEEIF